MTAQSRRPWLTEYTAQPRFSQPPSRLPWVSCRDSPSFWIERVAEDGECINLGAFSSALREARLFDNQSIELPGAVIVLPEGQRLLRQFCQAVRQHYEAAGLREYDYPCLAPLSSIKTFSEVFPSDHKVLFVGTRKDLEQSKPRAALLPTGEPIIYGHWRKIVRHIRDLPIEMYRQTRFFRPWSRSRSGGGIFNALEGADMFEFHCCYQKGSSEAAALRLFGMLRGLVDALCVPVLWSTRPPWSNHAQVALSSVGGDSPLPSRATLQIGTLYDQADIFSRRFGITYLDESGHHTNPHHVVGAVSRRLLIAHLLHGMLTNGSFLPHPEISPEQVHVVIRPTEFDPAESASKFVDDLRSRGLRVRSSVANSSRDIAEMLRHTQRLLVPLIVLLQGRRHGGDLVRIVIRRGDDLSEICRRGSDFTSASCDLIFDCLVDISAAYQARVRRYLSTRCVEAREVEDVRSVLQSRKVAICPLEFSSSSVDQVSSWKQGEILGFVDAPEPQSCVLSGCSCNTIAFISPRA